MLIHEYVFSFHASAPGLTVTSVVSPMRETNMHELLATGHTSSRTRQNRALCLALRLGLDWRVAAELYECILGPFRCGE